MLRVGEDASDFFDFLKISRGGKGDHILCPDDPETGEPEVFDLVFDGCNFQVSQSRTRGAKNHPFKFQSVFTVHFNTYSGISKMIIFFLPEVH